MGNVHLSAAVCSTLLMIAVPGAYATVSDAAFAALQARVDREDAAREISNVMGLRANWAAADRGDLVVGLFAQKQRDVSFSFNGAHVLIGLDKIKDAFGWSPERARQTLEGLSKRYPQIDNKPENYGAGDWRVHGLLSPVIEVAGDGRTAKGFWQTIGPALLVSNGEPRASLSFEKYAVDFIKEDGQWRIWHMHAFVEYEYALDKPFAEQVKESLTPSRGGPPDAEGQTYPSWSPIRVPRQVELPRPYRTFSETFSYGPPQDPK